MVKRFIPSTTNPELYDIIVETISSLGPLETTPDIQLESYDNIVGYSVDNFIDDFYDLLSKYQQTTNDFKDFSIQPKYGYYDLSSDESNAIRYKIMQTTPSGLSRESEPHRGIKAHQWMLIDILDDKENPGYQVLLYQKPIDVTLEISSWSKNYRDANRGAVIIEDLLETYRRIFHRKGLQQMRFLGRKEDIVNQQAHTVTYGCPLQYYLRTVKVKKVYEKVLETLTIELTTHRH